MFQANDLNKKDHLDYPSFSSYLTGTHNRFGSHKRSDSDNQLTFKRAYTQQKKVKEVELDSKKNREKQKQEINKIRGEVEL